MDEDGENNQDTDALPTIQEEETLHYAPTKAQWTEKISVVETALNHMERIGLHFSMDTHHPLTMSIA